LSGTVAYSCAKHRPGRKPKSRPIVAVDDAGELLRVLSAPIRLAIIAGLADGAAPVRVLTDALGQRASRWSVSVVCNAESSDPSPRHTSPGHPAPSDCVG
jgi:hypothetical protein